MADDTIAFDEDKDEFIDHDEYLAFIKTIRTQLPEGVKDIESFVRVSLQYLSFCIVISLPLSNFLDFFRPLTPSGNLHVYKSLSHCQVVYLSVGLSMRLHVLVFGRVSMFVHNCTCI